MKDLSVYLRLLQPKKFKSNIKRFKLNQIHKSLLFTTTLINKCMNTKQTPGQNILKKLIDLDSQ